MIVAVAGLWALVAVVAVLAWRRDRTAPRRALCRALGLVATLLPRVMAALVIAGFAVALLPTAALARLLEGAGGGVGLLVATVAGAMTPGGPMVAFPIALAFAQLEVATPVLVSYVTAWAVLAPHRAVAFEAPVMGWRFAGVRLVASLGLPPAAGALAWLVVG